MFQLNHTHLCDSLTTPIYVTVLPHPFMVQLMTESTVQYFHIQSHNCQFEKQMGSIRHLWANNLCRKNPHFLTDLTDFFLTDTTCEAGFPHWVFWTLTGVLDFSLSGDLSFLLICLTGNLWFSFTGFNKIKDLHLPDLLVLMWGCCSGLVSILDVFSDVRHSLSISLLLRSSNLEIFCNIGYANFKASCFLFKEALSFWFHVLHSVFPSFCYWTACLLPVYFLCHVWLCSASRKSFAKSFFQSDIWFPFAAFFLGAGFFIACLAMWALSLQYDVEEAWELPWNNIVIVELDESYKKELISLSAEIYYAADVFSFRFSTW